MQSTANTKERTTMSTTRNPRNPIQILRLERLTGRLTHGMRYLGSPEIGMDRAKLACEITRSCHDIMGGLTASRVALTDTYIAETPNRALAEAAQQAIIEAEHAVMRYREAVLAPHGIKPWDADPR